MTLHEFAYILQISTNNGTEKLSCLRHLKTIATHSIGLKEGKEILDEVWHLRYTKHSIKQLHYSKCFGYAIIKRLRNYLVYNAIGNLDNWKKCIADIHSIDYNKYINQYPELQ